MAERTTVAIAGGGPAGMVLGLLLARAGIEVTVIEKHADFLRDFRGDTVHPSTLQLLDELGLGEKFAAVGHSRLYEVSFPNSDGSQVVIGDFGRLRGVPHPYIAMVPQWDLLDLLADAARQEPTFSLRMSTEVVGLITEGEAVRGVRYRTADGTAGEVHATLSVAADGRASIARAAMNLPLREYPVPMDAWWFRLPRTADDVPALAPRAADGQAGVIFPREDYLQAAYIGPKGADAQIRREGVGRFRERVAALWPWLADRTAAIASMDDVKHLDVRLNLLRRWHTDGLLLIGDAAHAMSPIGGVGINLAVQDAVAAARLLAAPLARGEVRPRDLARVRRRRWAPTVAVQAVQRAMHRLLVQPVLAGRRAGPPSGVLRLLELLPWLRIIPAYAVGFGLLPEHAPDFARR